MNEVPSPPQEIPSEEKDKLPSQLSSDEIVSNSQHGILMMHEVASDIKSSLQSHPQLVLPEPELDIVEYNQLTPTQAHGDESTPVPVISQAKHLTSTSVTQEVWGSSNSLVDQLIEMHLELQHKERELQTITQELQRYSNLQDRYKQLEEEVQRMKDEVREQNLHTDWALNKKDIEINSWKKKYEEKEHVTEMLRIRVASNERERMRLEEALRENMRKLEENNQLIAALKKKATQKNEAGSKRRDRRGTI